MKHITTFSPSSSVIILGLLCLFASLPAPANSQQARAELTPETFSIDEAATLQITVENAQEVDIEMPEIDGLLFHHRGKSSQVQIVNGAVTSSVVYSYLVEPVKEGSYEIPPIRIDLENKTIRTGPLTCTVTAPSGGQNRQQPASPGKPETTERLAFITVVPEKTAIYRGETVPATIKAYFKRGTRVNQLTLPRLLGEGILIDELSSNPPQTQEIVDNTAYRVLVWDSFLTGVKEGVHDLSLELDATVLVPAPKRTPLPGFGSGFFNDDFFGDMFSGYSSRPVQAASEHISMEVMPLPESSKPESFSGAIGRYTLHVDARPTTIDPGEPVTLTISVAGSGTFTSVEAPTLSGTDGIKVYSPTAVFTADQSPYSGTKQFEQAIVFTDPAAREIPPVTFSYFDPDAKRYRTLFSDPIPIVINRLIAEDTSPPAIPPHHLSESAQSAEKEKKTESLPVSLVPVKLDAGTPVDRIRPVFLSGWYVAAVSLCLLLIAGFFGFQAYSVIQAGNTEAVNRKKGAAKRKETLARLDELSPDAPDFPARARALVGDFLIVLQNLDSASLTSADVANRCGSDSAAAELFRLGDTTLYGKHESTPAEKRDLLERIKSFVAEVS